MALARVKTWIAGEVLTASDLNSEFNNLLNNAASLISPLGGNLLFTPDATYDIGASGATRPRDLFLSRDLTYGRNVITVAAPNFCEGRLTLTTGVPVTTGDVTAAETLYFTPYKGNRIALYDGSGAWTTLIFTELSVDVPDVTGVHDVFAYNNSGTAALEVLVWSTDTARATALTLQNGVLVKTGATTRRYLGSFYSTTAGNGQIEDSVAKRNLWNYYNRVLRPMQALDATNTWTYTTAAFRQANASTANQLEYVQGVSEDAVSAYVSAMWMNGGAAATMSAGSGIGVDSTTVSSAQLMDKWVNIGNNQRINTRASYRGFPGVGRHLLIWLETSDAADTTTWYGDNNQTNQQSGIIGELLG